MGAKTPKRKSVSKDDSPFKKGNFTPGKAKGRNSGSPNPFKNTNGTPQSAKKFNKNFTPKKTPGGTTQPIINKEPFSASKTPKVKEEFSSPATAKTAGKETFSPKITAKVKQEPSSATKAPKVKQEPSADAMSPNVKQESAKKSKKVKRRSSNVAEISTNNDEAPPTKKAKLQKFSGTSSLFDSSQKAAAQKTDDKVAAKTVTQEKNAGKSTVKERKKARSEKWKGVCKTIRESRNEIRRALQTKDVSGLSLKPEEIKKKIDVRKKVPLEKMSKSSKAALGTYCKLYELMTGIDEFPKVKKTPPTAEDIKRRIGELESNSNVTKSGRKRLRLLKKRYKEMTRQGTVVKRETKGKETASAVNSKKNKAKNKMMKDVTTVQKKESSDSEEEAEDTNVSLEESAESNVNEDSASEDEADDADNDKMAEESEEVEESENEDGEDESNESDYDVESNVKADKLTKKMNDDAGESSDDEGKSKKSKLSVLKKMTEMAPEEKRTGKEKKGKKKQKGDKTKKSGEKEEPFLNQNQKRYVAFVGNLPYDVTVEEIKAHFQKVGEVKHVRIPTEKGSNKPRGFAFVEVNDDKTYQKTLSMHQTFIKGRKINVSFTSGGKKIGGEKMKEIKAKNMKLQALRKQGKLTGSVKPSQKRAARREKRKHLQTSKSND